jgi:hypothetical protein
MSACPIVFHIIAHMALLPGGGGGGDEIVENIICVLIFTTTSVWNISHSKKNSAKYCHKFIPVFMWRTLSLSNCNQTW